MNGRRVVITGMGVVSSLGLTVDGMWEALLEGRSGIGQIQRIRTDDMRVTIAGEISDWNSEDHFDKRGARRMDLVAQFAVVAAQSAWADCGLAMDALDPARVGCIMGSGVGGLGEIEAQCENLFDKGPRRVSPMLVPKMMANAVSGEVSLVLGAQGPNYTTVSACASGGHAISLAARAVAGGRSDVVITGGSEAAIVRIGMSGFASMKALSTRNDDPEHASRPFDRDRDGFVMGEGAGVLILEEYEAAKARGAVIYAELLGSGFNGEAHHITAPRPDGSGAAAAMTAALNEAGLNPEDVDYVNAHGTSTPLNDVMETKAIRLAFGDHADKLLVNSTKSMLGHLLGASGGVEGIVAALSVHGDVVHPTANHDNPDPECDLDYVADGAREGLVRTAICNSFGFGGHNVAVCFGKPR